MPPGSDPGSRSAAEIFYEALALQPEDRAAFLRVACGSDALLRAEVDSLLRADEAATDQFLDPAELPGRRPPQLAEDPTAMVGATVGSYRLEERIGGGGMGDVYRGRRADDAFEKRVAVKLLRADLRRPDFIERFTHERNVLASLDHPSIARLLDGGACGDGTPFLVMEYVEGVALDSYCNDRKLSLRDRLELFATVCRAVHYAHRNLVVHRDLKPGNILVTEEGEVKLLDFGIAKVLDDDAAGDQTLTGHQLLTPRYASPEQMDRGRITTASDVYALGVILYELLAGQHPYPKESTDTELRRAILDEIPPKPSAVATNASGLSGDLDNIVLHAVRKEPDRRYLSAAEFADDIGRHLSGLPVVARPDTLRYRASKFVRRNAVVVVAAAAVFLAMAGAAVVSTRLYLRAESAKEETVRQREVAEQIAEFLENALGSIRPETARGRDISLLREVLDSTSERMRAELDSGTPVASALGITIGNAYMGLGLFDEAESHFRASVAAREDGGSSTNELREARYHLGLALLQRGQIDEAKAVLVSAAKPLPERPRDRDVRLLDAGVAAELGRALYLAGDYDQSERYRRESLRIYEGAVGPLDDRLIEAYLNLGHELTTREQLDEARRLIATGLEKAEEAGDEYVLSSALQTWAFHHGWSGDYVKAEAFYRRALEIDRVIFGEDHPRIGILLASLASTVESQERLEEAERLYRESLRIQELSFGPDHFEVATSSHNLSVLLRKTGRCDDAIPLSERAIKIYKDGMGPDHAWVAIALLNYTATLHSCKRRVDAWRALEECRLVAGKHWPPDHWRFGILDSIEGSLLAEEGRPEEARRLLAGSLDKVRAQLAEDDPRRLEVEERARSIYGRELVDEDS